MKLLFYAAKIYDKKSFDPVLEEFSGTHILTTVPPSSLKEKDMVPPHIM